MEDKLKQFVEDHRDQLDVYEPPQHLWNGIDDRLKSNRKDGRWRWVAIASSLMLIVTCGAWMFFASQRHTHEAAPVVHVQSPLMQAEAYFTALVQMKDAELDKYCTPNPELCREFEKDLETLNGEYRKLKAEYQASGEKKILLQAMMTNLQMQVQLISRQLQIMEAVKQKKEQVKYI